MKKELGVTNTKIVTYDQWSSIRSKLESKTIVHCHGVFDLMHIGHIKHLRQANSFGDILVVTITPDRFVNKGPGHPAFPESLRAEVISALEGVDFVIINQWPTALEAIERIRPTYYVKGDEYKVISNDLTGQILHEKHAVEAVGGEIRYTTDDMTFSSSSIINRYLPTFSEHVQKWLFDFGKSYSSEKLLASIDQLGDLRVMVIGETIIDEYLYCDVMGKSGKEPVLAAKMKTEERYAGGVMAVANHVAAFAKKVDVVTFLGEERTHEHFLDRLLSENVTAHYLPKRNSPTLVKRRFVEQALNQKLFEVYDINDSPLSEDEEQLYLERIKKLLPKVDLVIAADYGHGIITPAIANYLSLNAPYLVVNTQANAGNNGMNSITKYPRADFITMTGLELSLEFRKWGNVWDQAERLCKLIGASKMLVTLGKKGLLVYDQKRGFSDAPAFAVKVVDRVGAGDAVLSVAALMMYKGLPNDMACFVGNIVGAEAVSIMGNSKALNKDVVKKHIVHLMK